MCGIAGFIDLKTRLSQPKMVKVGQSMGHVLSHRGPDAGDVWVDAETGVCLAHRRLTVVDLTETGHQPMESSCGQFVTIYNGEIYNAEELRTELLAKGRIFRGHSDTEVLVEGCAVWGVQEMAKRLVGMFAFAIWDKRERRLTLVRDRLGIKPLYWGLIGKQLLFGSELKALRTHPDCPKDVDRNAVASFLRYSNIPAPLTIYRGIEKLQPGHMLSFDGVKGIPIVESYWTLEDAVQTGKDNLLSGNDEEVIQEVGDLLEDSVKRRMVADVPLGAFLSGGIDSSTVVALMQKNSKTPIRSFSIGFEEKGYNEAQYAAAVAKHLKTDHTELYVTSQEAREVIPKLSDIYDEPFADSSQIPTYLVSALTRKHVTVALSGDGGDELFAGYNRYTTVERFQKMTR
ncbi:MAG: asparagine synthase (glutamine-hydrolyzing), partial [Alphaproteobacteria bacterium]|nr:asparagine synthase (glutamine-hydrolyzing) [Alphaproteobacteria bacterium]